MCAICTTAYSGRPDQVAAERDRLAAALDRMRGEVAHYDALASRLLVQRGAALRLLGDVQTALDLDTVEEWAGDIRRALGDAGE